MRRAARILVTAAMLAGLVPASAEAGIVQRPADSSELFFRASAGETNVVGVAILDDGSGYVVQDAGADLEAANGCVSLDQNTAFCPARRDDFWVMYLDDGNDQAALSVPGLTFACGGRGDDVIASTGQGHAVLFGEEGNDTLIGGPGLDGLYGDGDCDQVRYDDPGGNDTLYGAGGADELSGGGGNDQLDGGEGDDLLAGESGDDSLAGGPGADLLQGYAGTDVLHGGDGPDDLNGGAGNDQLYGDAGNDTLGRTVRDAGSPFSERGAQLLSEQGDDVLNGGAGDDVLEGGPGSGWASINPPAGQGPQPDQPDDGTNGADNLSGGDGQDTVSYENRSVAVSVSLDGVANDGSSGEGDLVSPDVEAVLGGSGDDRLTGSDGPDSLDGGPGRDLIDAAGGDDTIAGGAGDSADRLRGGSGTDTIHGGAGDDTLDGGDGPDQLDGGGGNDRLSGGAANDRLEGGTGIDQLDGGEGDDMLDGAAAMLRGNDGADLLSGGPGNDTLTGGPGDDTLQGGPGRDGMAGGDGHDTADYSDSSLPVTASLDGAANDGSPGEGDAVGGDIEGLRGGTGNDTLTGSSGEDTLEGGGGEDYLDGGGAHDALSAGAGSDVVVARDAVPEQVNCGRGADFAVPDEDDVLTACESDADPRRVPSLRRTVLATPGRGDARFSPPGFTRSVPLTAPTLVPAGTRLGGAVSLEAAAAHGKRRSAQVSGPFALRFGAGLTELAAAAPTGCPSAAGTTIVVSTKGGFRTRGTAADARGAGKWSSRETCSGTRIDVQAGTVEVKDPRTGRKVTLHRGGSYRGRRRR